MSIHCCDYHAAGNSVNSEIMFMLALAAVFLLVLLTWSTTTIDGTIIVPKQ